MPSVQSVELPLTSAVHSYLTSLIYVNGLSAAVHWADKSLFIFLVSFGAKPALKLSLLSMLSERARGHCRFESQLALNLATASNRVAIEGMKAFSLLPRTGQWSLGTVSTAFILAQIIFPRGCAANGANITAFLQPADPPTKRADQRPRARESFG